MINCFLIGLAFLLLHEMDAVRCREWRIFPGLSLLPERTGSILFMLAHIPLYYWVMLEVAAGRPAFRTGFDYFLLIHLGLHLLFLRHPNNEFKDWMSWLFIGGAGLFGLLDLLIS